MIKKNRLFKSFRFVMISTILKLKSFRTKKAMLICSYPRSGSTWIMEQINTYPNTIVNWEPLHVKKGVVPVSFFLGEKPLIPVDSKSSSYKRFFDRVFRFKTINQWSTWYCGFKQAITAKYVITKFVRANNLLPWFVNTYDFEYKPIYLLRHPIPTALSVIKSFSNNASELMNFTMPKTLNNDRYHLHVDYINGLLTRLEQHVAIWCIDNIEIINHNDSNQWLSVYYENFILDPKTTLSHIFETWNLNYDTTKLETIDFKKPSRTVYDKNDLKPDANLHIESFLEKFDQDELQRIQDILNHFGVKNYTAFDAYPKC
ncbi:sulfotransferase domain-containing protein [uncultured Psychroserpens sp.]|uniref:sulfotransferase domain-containing protein n=1 Tax=uncultured Psychroserpens sp. TaxID=255436 RepID=UPI002635075C|nr:sulfotransferase domain-containing protein [uncultured Psychroserpens sp.]